MLCRLSNKTKVLTRHLLYAIIIIVYGVVISKIKCPFVFLFHVQCPACGMTRALMSLFRGDITGYFMYNAMAVPLCLSVLLEIHKKLFTHKRFIDGACISIVIINFAYYLVHQTVNVFS